LDIAETIIEDAAYQPQIKIQAIKATIEHIPLLFSFMLERQSLDKCEETGVLHWLPGLLPETHVSIVLHI
jgi:hypothetical protein